MLSRRDVLKFAGGSCLLASSPLVSAIVSSVEAGDSKSMRCINVINFIRGVEPRFETDLLLPVRKQMELVLEHKLPATWLLQFDALVAGPFVEFLKGHIAKDHEVGFWFEMNEMLCKAANVEWRGRSGFEWDHYPLVAFTIGYSPEERVKLADAAMHGFQNIWGFFPKSVASWNLDSITVAHLTEHFGIDAYAVCRDQIATDGFTIWGAPIAGYYPSKQNCWSPAVSHANQIGTPIFRMLGQDPVYYYNNGFKLPDGRVVHEPDTMEPTWTSGRSASFNKAFLDMISETPTGQFAYAQLGQENSFPWPDTAEAYPKQMAALAKIRDAGGVHVETMGESGRRFKHAFSTTPVQSQIMLEDPYENTKFVERTVWYQSRFYRANLHFRDDLPFLRDLTVYSDHNAQPFLTHATRDHEVEQKMPAVLDGYHWSKSPGSLDKVGAGGFFEVDGQRLRLTGKPEVHEDGKNLVALLPVQDGRVLSIKFEEKRISFQITGQTPSHLGLVFEWDPAKSALKEVTSNRASYRYQEFDYSIGVQGGEAKATTDGWSVTAKTHEISLQMAQPI